MKSTFVLLVAAVALIAGSSIQAAEAGFQIFSKTEGQRLRVANDAHYSLVDAAGQKVAEGSNDYDFAVDVPAGEYNMVVEEKSTNFAGSLGVVVGEANEIKLLQLDRNGLSLINDAHACPDLHDGIKRHDGCDHDKDCICHRVDPQCDPNGAYAPQASSTATNSYTIPQSTLPTSTPNLPQIPSYGASYGASMGGGMGSLAILGAIGAIIAVAVADSDDPYRPEPVSSMYRYR